jgi:hypothetical protein
MCETMFFFSVQVCVDPWTVLRQADLRMNFFSGRIGIFLCFYVKKIVPVDMALGYPAQPGLKPILSQNYFGTILRYYFLVGAEIIP